MTQNEPLLLNKEQVAALLNVDERTLQRLLKEGRVPQPVQLLSNKPLWVKSRVVAWVSAGCPYVGPVPTPKLDVQRPKQGRAQARVGPGSFTLDPYAEE